jgi:hypothetical protein
VAVAVEDGAAVEWSSEVGAADWIVERLHPFASDVGSFVPEGLEAYARVLHPARRVEQGRRIKVRWAGVAPKAATAIHPAVQFEELRPGPEIEPPLEGTLERDELDALIELLARHTGTPRSCWFGIWEGYGWMQGGRAVAELVPRPAHWWSRRRRRRPVEPVAPPGPRVQVPGRSLALHRGPIEAAAAFCRPPAFQSPNLWCPADRAWCVASDIDLASTYLGGTRALVEEVLGDRRLEAVPARLTDPVHP